MFYSVSVWLHILSATVWIGGMAFLVLAVVPVTRQPEFRGLAATLIRLVGQRFRVIGWICLGLLAVTGFANLAFRGFTLESLWTGTLFSGDFGRTLAVKLVLVAAILSLSVLHDFVIGPRASALLQSDPGSPDAARLRRAAAWLGRINLLLAIVVVALAVLLVRGIP